MVVSHVGAGVLYKSNKCSEPPGGLSSTHWKVLRVSLTSSGVGTSSTGRLLALWGKGPFRPEVLGAWRGVGTRPPLEVRSGAPRKWHRIAVVSSPEHLKLGAGG